jgi:acetaldehyde dehydrogenase (acetylating)
VFTTHEGLEGFRRAPIWAGIDIVFDATSAGSIDDPDYAGHHRYIGLRAKVPVARELG